MGRLSGVKGGNTCLPLPRQAGIDFHGSRVPSGHGALVRTREEAEEMTLDIAFKKRRRKS